MRNIETRSDPHPMILNRHGDPLHYSLHAAAAPRGVALICHGFKGFKDWGFFPHLAQRLCDAGWTALRFNFSLNGVGAHQDFVDLDAFGRNTLTRECEDLEDMISAITEARVVDAATAALPLVLLGHSRGGGISILVGERMPRVRGVVTWASVCTFARYGDETIRQWKKSGRIDIQNARTGQMMPLYVTLLDDYEQHEADLDVLSAASRMIHPWLILHGDQDVSVPVEEARRLYEVAAPRLTTLAIVPHTDHVFGSVHPFAGESQALRQAIEETVRWLSALLPAESEAERLSSQD